MDAPEPVSQAEQTRPPADVFGSPQSRLSPRIPEAAGPLAERADGTWAPGPPGPLAVVDPPLSAEQVAEQSSPEAIATRAADLEVRVHDAAERARAGLR